MCGKYRLLIPLLTAIGCAHQQGAKVERLPPSVLKARQADIRDRWSLFPSKSSDGVEHESVVAPQPVRPTKMDRAPRDSIVLDDEGFPVRNEVSQDTGQRRSRSTPSWSVRWEKDEEETRSDEPILPPLAESPRSKAPTPSSLPPADYEREIDELARKIKRSAPEMAPEFIAAVQAASAADNLPTVLSVWRGLAPYLADAGKPNQAADVLPTERVATKPVVVTAKKIPDSVEPVKNTKPELHRPGESPASEPAKPTQSQSPKPKGDDGEPVSPEPAMGRRAAPTIAPPNKIDLNLATLSPRERRFWESLTQVWEREAKSLGDAPSQIGTNQSIEGLSEALATLRLRSDLEVSLPILCKSVVNFGNYTPFEPAVFATGQSMVVYWEVRNFVSVESSDGYRTRLSAKLELFDSQGESRQKLERNFPDDICKRRRVDFFNAVLLQLPKDLPVGDYTLKVTVTDHSSEKFAQRQTRLTVR